MRFAIKKKILSNPLQPIDTIGTRRYLHFNYDFPNVHYTTDNHRALNGFPFRLEPDTKVHDLRMLRQLINKCIPCLSNTKCLQEYKRMTFDRQIRGEWRS